MSCAYLLVGFLILLIMLLFVVCLTVGLLLLFCVGFSRFGLVCICLILLAD